MIQIRQYQQILISELRAEMRKGHTKLILQLPTGGGKTIIFSFMVKEAAAKGLKCMILTHRMELLEQAGGTFDLIGISYQNITSETNAIPNGNVLVAMIETIKRRVKTRLDFTMLLKTIDLLIIDECHRAEFNAIFQYLKSECYVIGFTATPVSSNSKHPLSDYYTSIVSGPTINNLIQSGNLSEPIYYGVKIDLSSIRLKAGEFDENDMTKLYGERKIFSGLKENLENHAKNKKTLIFCPSVASSIQVAKELNCLHVDGFMRQKDLRLFKYNLEKFSKESNIILTNCGILTTGYDEPTIEHGVLYRATTSLTLFMQMIGRLSRITETKKTFSIDDFGMNIQRFGFWHTDRIWLLNPVKKRNKREGTFPVKFCPQCGAVISVNVKKCEYCGYEWQVTEKERIFAELGKLTYSDIQKRMNEAKSIEEMEQIRISKGYKTGFLLHKFTKLEQFIEYGKLRNYHYKWAKINAERYGISL